MKFKGSRAEEEFQQRLWSGGSRAFGARHHGTEEAANGRRRVRVAGDEEERKSLKLRIEERKRKVRDLKRERRCKGKEEPD